MRAFLPGWILAAVVGLLVPGCFTLDFDGDGVRDVPYPAGYEVDYVSCSDGYDNDVDGRIDCEDSDCLMFGHCPGLVPLAPYFEPERTFSLCTDGVDNDDDGQFDCGDRDCQNIRELCCLGETNNITCSDRRDNDGNGFADCTDFSCRNNPFVEVCDAETTCFDLNDENGDGSTTCTQEQIETVRDTQCADRIDNDGDRRTDCNDEDCACAEPCNPGCRGPEDTLERCTDGIDNDNNTFFDCGEFDCNDTRNTPPTGPAAEYCAERAENTLERCMDGIDNDGNGFFDCGEFDCNDTRNTPPTGPAAEYCASIAENTLERCRDGIDNDENGFTDCGDFSCSREGDEETLAYCRTQTETSFETCHDLRDNDGNGFSDCGDFSCDFVSIARGFIHCEARECPEGFECIEFSGRRICDRECGLETECPDGSECIGGSCQFVCDTTDDCPTGTSCYNGECLSIASPCTESSWFDRQSTIQSSGSGLNQDSSLEQQIAMSVANCTDGIDNDLDGFVDCEDWDCNHNPRVVDEEGNPLCRSAGGRTCVIGPNVGGMCLRDEDCGMFSGGCAQAGPDGLLLVCP